MTLALRVVSHACDMGRAVRRKAVDAPAVDAPADVVASRLVGVAVGVTMATFKMVYEQAYSLLLLASRRQRRELRDVAEDVVEQTNTTMASGAGSTRSLRARLKSVLKG